MKRRHVVVKVENDAQQFSERYIRVKDFIATTKQRTETQVVVKRLYHFRSLCLL